TTWKPQPAASMRSSFQILGQPVPVTVMPTPALVQRLADVSPSLPSAESESGPPRVEPVTVIRIEYVQVPLVAQLQSLLPIPQMKEQQAAREQLAGPGVPNLASQVNRAIVPTTDL